MPYNSRPNFRRKILGGKLTKAREAKGLRVEDVAETAGQSTAAIYRHESGHTAVKPSLIPFYTELYGINDPIEVERWKEWARRARDKGPWAESGGMVGPTFRDYADAESFSEELRVWELGVIPGLLQTRRYSEELIRGSATVRPGQLPDEETEVEERVLLRESRKEILDRETPPRIWVVIGESAILTPPSVSISGPAEAHAEQVQHLLNLGETKVTIQVLPMDTGLHIGLSGAFTLITFDDVDMVFREGYGDGSFIDDEERVRAYRARYERLQSQALSISDTRRYLHRVLAKM